MADIIRVRTISSATETAISMANGTFARLVSIGTSWNTIRVGIRLHMDDNGGALASTPRFAIGFSAGTANQFGDSSTTHFVGVVSTSTSWAYQTTFHNATNFAPAKRVSTTLTTGTTLIANGAINIGLTLANRGLIFCDVTKGNPNYTMNLFIPSNTTGADISSTTFLSQMELTTPSLGSYTYTAGQTLAVNEGTDGTLTAANISWDRTFPSIEICDLAVAILS